MDICEASGFGNKRIDRHPWELARIKVVKNLLEPLCRGQSKITILDMGCGDVYVAQKLSEHFTNAQFYCVDIAFTDEIKRTLEERVKGFPISIFSSLEEVTSKANIEQVDVVLLLDVIEHIEDEISFMKYLGQYGLITPETHVTITVPAYQALFSNHDIYLKHYRRYNLALLSDHLQKADFIVKKNGYFFLLLLIPRIVQKLTQSKQAVDMEKGIGRYKAKPGLDGLLIFILYTDYFIGKIVRLIGIKIPGLSCFAICQKQR